MNFQDLVDLYDKKKAIHGKNAYRHISALLQEAKVQHREDFFNSVGALKTQNSGKLPDHEQSWRAFKGKNLEKLIVSIIEKEVQALGLEVINGNSLERTEGSKLSKELSLVKRNLLVDYGDFGSHLPDVDIVIYKPQTSEVVAVLSSKVTLRERVAQTGYWKLKLASDKVTEHIKVFFVTPDEDETLRLKKPTKKGRAIIEIDTDGCYVLSAATFEESSKVKTFDKLINDIKSLIK